MAKTCIICGNSAGSGEHIFPSALGGKRVNKGIYCEKHNNGFSPHVVVLLEQLNIFNAILSVIPDRGNKEPRPFKFEDESGRQFSMVGEKITVAPPPPVSQLEVAADGRHTVMVSDMNQFYQWKKEQEALGYKIDLIGKGEEIRQYNAEPYKVGTVLGSEAGLKAIGYLALTFFAHYFPLQARQPGLDSFKAYVDVDGAFHPEFVSWDNRDALDVIGQNKFRFGHTIVVALSAKEKKAYAYISLFSALNFTISLGEVDVEGDAMYTTYIDPLAKSMPEDISTSDSINTSLRDSHGSANFGELLNSGMAQRGVQRFLEDVSAWRLEKLACEIFADFEAVRGKSSTEIIEKVASIIDINGQRILNLVTHAVDELRKHLSKEPGAEKICAMLDHMIVTDKLQTSGLSTVTQAVFYNAKGALIAEISDRLIEGKLTEDNLAMLIGGGEGIAHVTKCVILPMLRLN